MGGAGPALGTPQSSECKLCPHAQVRGSEAGATWGEWGKDLRKGSRVGESEKAYASVPLNLQHAPSL